MKSLETGDKLLDKGKSLFDTETDAFSAELKYG
jgi:hypothetical protein